MGDVKEMQRNPQDAFEECALWFTTQTIASVRFYGLFEGSTLRYAGLEREPVEELVRVLRSLRPCSTYEIRSFLLPHHEILARTSLPEPGE